MDKWVCELCGYVYDPEKGSEGAAPGTPFEELPDDWECPECYADKSQFKLEYLAKQKTPRR
ncbi:MAG: rubredoxin [Bacillota bacterium]